MAIVFETLMAEDLDLGTSTTTKTAPGGGTLNGHQISLSSLSLDGATAVAPTATWDPGEIAGGQSVATTIAVIGAAVGDIVVASMSSMGSDNLILGAHVQSDNTVRTVLANPTADSITPASGTIKVLVFRVR